MLVLPVRSQDSSPNCLDNDSYKIDPLSARHQEPSPQTSDLREQVAGAMLSVMPPVRPSASKRPKLSLQTSIPPSSPTQKLGACLNLSTDSPTTRNTNVNAQEPPPPPPTPCSALRPQVNFPSSLPASSSTTSSSSTSGLSPFSNSTPYILPIGTHSILRNSPIPRRHLSATSARQPKRMFSPIKRVAFQEELVDILPAPDLEASLDDGDEYTQTEEEQRRRREEIQAEDGHATSILGRRKRRREWVWRPLEDDILIEHDLDRGLRRRDLDAQHPPQGLKCPKDWLGSPASIPLPGSAIPNDDISIGVSV